MQAYGVKYAGSISLFFTRARIARFDGLVLTLHWWMAMRSVGLRVMFILARKHCFSNPIGCWFTVQASAPCDYRTDERLHVWVMMFSHREEQVLAVRSRAVAGLAISSSHRRHSVRTELCLDVSRVVWGTDDVEDRLSTLHRSDIGLRNASRVAQ